MIVILYVEDDASSRDVVRMADRMNPGQYDLIIFDDSQEFEDKLINLDPQPQLILLDIHMTPLTGFQMLEIIRSYPQYDATPVVALTASVMNEEVQLLHEAGFSGAIAKPLNLDTFSDLIGRILGEEEIWSVW